MFKSFRLSSFLCVLVFALSLSLGAGLAQAAYINTGTEVYTNPPGFTAFADGYDNQGDLTATSSTSGNPAMHVDGGFANSGTLDDFSNVLHASIVDAIVLEWKYRFYIWLSANISNTIFIRPDADIADDFILPHIHFKRFQFK